MLGSIWDDVKKQFSYGNMVTRLIIINVAIFLIINLLKVFLHHGAGGETPGIYNDLVHFFCISSDPWHMITHPWSIITFMFMHEGFWHILWNMLFLFWFGRIVGDLAGDHRILPLYILGSFAGAAAFFITANLLPWGAGATNFALGASAGVMAIVVASGVLAPEYSLQLILLGSVKLKYVVAAILFLDLVGTASDINTGGHFAHLGGAAYGWLFVLQLRQGNDWGASFNKFFDKIAAFFSNMFAPREKKNRPRVVHRNKEKIRDRRSRPHAKSDSSKDLSHQEKLDSILDKIKKDGYDSLTEAEKEFLFNASKK